MKPSEFVFWVRGYCKGAISSDANICPLELLDTVEEVIRTMTTQVVPSVIPMQPIYAPNFIAPNTPNMPNMRHLGVATAKTP